jgi:acetyl esterase/lipase
MAGALRAAGAEVQYTELPGVGHESWVEAFESAELPRWLLARSRSGRAAPPSLSCTGRESPWARASWAVAPQGFGNCCTRT